MSFLEGIVGGDRGQADLSGIGAVLDGFTLQDAEILIAFASPADAKLDESDCVNGRLRRRFTAFVTGNAEFDGVIDIPNIFKRAHDGRVDLQVLMDSEGQQQNNIRSLIYGDGVDKLTAILDKEICRIMEERESATNSSCSSQPAPDADATPKISTDDLKRAIEFPLAAEGQVERDLVLGEDQAALPHENKEADGKWKRYEIFMEILENLSPEQFDNQATGRWERNSLQNIVDEYIRTNKEDLRAPEAKKRFVRRELMRLRGTWKGHPANPFALQGNQRLLSKWRHLQAKMLKRAAELKAVKPVVERPRRSGRGKKGREAVAVEALQNEEHPQVDDLPKKGEKRAKDADLEQKNKAQIDVPKGDSARKEFASLIGPQTVNKTDQKKAPKNVGTDSMEEAKDAEASSTPDRDDDHSPQVPSTDSSAEKSDPKVSPVFLSCRFEAGNAGEQHNDEAEDKSASENEWESGTEGEEDFESHSDEEIEENDVADEEKSAGHDAVELAEFTSKESPLAEALETNTTNSTPKVSLSCKKTSSNMSDSESLIYTLKAENLLLEARNRVVEEKVNELSEKIAKLEAELSAKDDIIEAFAKLSTKR